MGVFTALCTMEKSHDQHMHDEARLKSLHAIAHALVAYGGGSSVRLVAGGLCRAVANANAGEASLKQEAVTGLEKLFCM